MMQEVRRWFGSPEQKVTVIIFPTLHPWEEMIDLEAGIYLSRTPYITHYYYENYYGEYAFSFAARELLAGRHRYPSDAEQILLWAWEETEQRREGIRIELSEPAQRSQQDLYRQKLAAQEIADWLEKYPAAGRQAIHSLYRLARERPLVEEDLAVFRSPDL
jgi:hypothetical protein